MKKVIKGFLILSLVSTLIGCGNEKIEEPTNEEDIKINTEENVIKDQSIETFEMKQTSLVYLNGTTTLETTVTNVSPNTEYLKEFEIIVSKGGEELITLTGFVGDNILSGESKTIHSYCSEDLSTADEIVYKVIR